jgi:ribonucleoside-diphosphate reductase alpha chain
MISYIRNKKINPNDDNQTPDHVDKNGEKWKQFHVIHPTALEYLLLNPDKNKEWEEVKANTPKSKWDLELKKILPEWFVSAEEINIEQRINLQAAAQLHIDHGISSTLNRPKGTKPSEVSDIYFKSWKAGLKGVTVYVDGSKGNSVLSSLSTEAKLTERPKELSCDIHHPVVNGKKWTILIGLYDGKPYEVFGGLNEYLDFPKNIEKGTIVKSKDTNKKKSYNLILQNGTDKVLIDDIIETFDSDVYAHSTRLLSLLLRNGTPIHEIVDQLSKEDKNSNLYSFSKVIARVLKPYIIEGSKSKEECPVCSAKLIFYQGCMTCSECGHSKCN